MGGLYGRFIWEPLVRALYGNFLRELNTGPLPLFTPHVYLTSLFLTDYTLSMLYTSPAPLLGIRDIMIYNPGQAALEAPVSRPFCERLPPSS